MAVTAAAGRGGVGVVAAIRVAALVASVASIAVAVAAVAAVAAAVAAVAVVVFVVVVPIDLQSVQLSISTAVEKYIEEKSESAQYKPVPLPSKDTYFQTFWAQRP